MSRATKAGCAALVLRAAALVLPILLAGPAPLRAQDPDSAVSSPPAPAETPAEEPRAPEPRAQEPPARTQPPVPARPVPRTSPAAGAARARTAPPTEGVIFSRVPVAHEESRPPARSIAPGAKGSLTSKMCGVCHADVRVNYDKGVHRAEGITCTSCHGGDPNAITVESAHRGDFRGKPSRRSIPALCASCHSDVARMRVYNLPSDQYALYQTSHHGQALARGDENVAVCTDCHGIHEIRRHDDPKSSVFGRNIPTTCGKCHGNASFLARYGRKDNPVADYNASVHGKAFLSGNNNAPVCTRCHGSHGATPPGASEVAMVCGQCHIKTRTFFVASVHKEAMDAAGEPECAACHHNHKTQAATPAMLDTVCMNCHEKGGSEARVAGTFRRMIGEASTAIAHAEKRVGDASRIPLYVEDYQSRLQDARTALLESEPVTHSLDTSLVEPHTRRARSIAASVEEEVDEKVSGRWWRIVGLVLFWFYLLLTFYIVLRARRRAAAAER